MRRLTRQIIGDGLVWWSRSGCSARFGFFACFSRTSAGCCAPNCLHPGVDYKVIRLPSPITFMGSTTLVAPATLPSRPRHSVWSHQPRWAIYPAGSPPASSSCPARCLGACHLRGDLRPNTQRQHDRRKYPVLVQISCREILGKTGGVEADVRALVRFAAPRRGSSVGAAAPDSLCDSCVSSSVTAVVRAPSGNFK